jgi:hypothetical protein
MGLCLPDRNTVQYSALHMRNVTFLSRANLWRAHNTPARIVMWDRWSSSSIVTWGLPVGQNFSGCGDGVNCTLVWQQNSLRGKVIGNRCKNIAHAPGCFMSVSLCSFTKHGPKHRRRVLHIVKDGQKPYCKFRWSLPYRFPRRLSSASGNSGTHHRSGYW